MLGSIVINYCFLRYIAKLKKIYVSLMTEKLNISGEFIELKQFVLTITN